MLSEELHDKVILLEKIISKISRTLEKYSRLEHRLKSGRASRIWILRKTRQTQIMCNLKVRVLKSWISYRRFRCTDIVWKKNTRCINTDFIRNRSNNINSIFHKSKSTNGFSYQNSDTIEFENRIHAKCRISESKNPDSQTRRIRIFLVTGRHSVSGGSIGGGGNQQSTRITEVYWHFDDIW